MRILIAPNAFKHSLSADAVAKAIARGFDASRLDCTCIVHPVGDGGDGTGRLLTGHLGGAMIETRSCDPLSRPIVASYGWIGPAQTAIIEMAEASGLKLLAADECDPRVTTSAGTGALIRAALDRGARRILLCVGGSATVDGGAGLLAALGARFLDCDGRALSPVAEQLSQLDRIDIAGIDKRLAECPITILCDVINPVTGEEGAAAVFGPQKGASPETVEMLEAALSRMCEVIERQTGIAAARVRHGGAAGGIAASLHALIGARLTNGIEEFLDITGFDARLGDVDLVVTGEGRIDVQTLQGKAPYGVAERARRQGKRVIALAGEVPLDPLPRLRQLFDVLVAIGAGPASIAESLPATARNLERTATEIANAIALNSRSIG